VLGICNEEQKQVFLETIKRAVGPRHEMPEHRNPDPDFRERGRRGEEIKNFLSLTATSENDPVPKKKILIQLIMIKSYQRNITSILTWNSYALQNHFHRMLP
jgi:hypothetical protein